MSEPLERGYGYRFRNRRAREERGVTVNFGRPEIVRKMAKVHLAVVDPCEPAGEPPEPRPKTRADCKDGPRPCPWVGCKHHLYLDIRTGGRSITFNFPDLEPWELAVSCSLDVADAGRSSLLRVGELMNFTRERTRQIEAIVLEKVRASREMKELTLDVDGDLSFAKPRGYVER